MINELCELFLNVADGDTVILEKDKTYHVRQDDSFVLDGYYCSNSAKMDENPTGRRYTALYLKDKKNVTVDGNGATVLIHGKMTPILLDRCQDITFKNLTIDYACPTMAEITVAACEDGEYTLKINPECLFRVEGNDLYWRGETGKDGVPAIRYSPKVMRQNSREYVHGKLTATGNRFEEPPFGSHSIWLNCVREAEIWDNRFAAPYTVKTRCVGNVREEGNLVNT